MKTPALALFAFFAPIVAGCSLVQALEGGGNSSTATTTSGTGGASTSGVGISCGTNPETSATLCLGNSLCPGLLVSTEVYPGCGYRVSGALIDIECSCNGFLCPLGATTCADAQTKLADQNYGVVCGQVSAGTCTQGTPASASSSSSGGGCDTSCRDSCAGEPTCIQACGC